MIPCSRKSLLWLLKAEIPNGALPKDNTALLNANQVL